MGAVKVVHLSIHLCRYKRWSINSLICLSNHSVGFLREKFCTIPSKIRTFCDVNWTTTGAPDHYKSHSVNCDGRCPLLLLLIFSAHHRIVAPSLINKNAGVSDVMNGSVRSKLFQSSYCAKGRFFCSRPNFSRRTRAETLDTQATWMAAGSLVFRLMKHLCLTYLVENFCWTPVAWCYRVRKLIKRNDQLSVVMLTSGRQYTTCLRLPTLGNEKKYCDTVDTSVRGLFFPFLRVSADGRFDYLIKAFYV